MSSATSSVASITVTDDANRTVTIVGAPQRIVSLAPSTTEIAFALGLGNRIIAVDSYSDFPVEAQSLPKLNTFPLNLEQVVALKPDLVLAAGLTNPDDVKKLADLKLNVLVIGSATTTFDGVMADIALLGKATGTEAKAKQINDTLKQKIDAVKGKVAVLSTNKPKVYWELDMTDVTKPYTPGPGSFIDDIITLAGGTNIAAKAKSPWAQISAEEIIAANPDIIILSDACSTSVLSPCATPESVKARKGWDVINAVKNGKILGIDDNLVSRPGPRIADGLEAAAKLIRPEAFK
jgi:iron complex transport system substrate-binding protein